LTWATGALELDSTGAGATYTGVVLVVVGTGGWDDVVGATYTADSVEAIAEDTTTADFVLGSKNWAGTAELETALADEDFLVAGVAAATEETVGGTNPSVTQMVVVTPTVSVTYS